MGNKKVDKPKNWLLVKNLQFELILRLCYPSHEFFKNWGKIVDFFINSQILSNSTFLLPILYEGFRGYFARKSRLKGI